MSALGRSGGRSRIVSGLRLLGFAGLVWTAWELIRDWFGVVGRWSVGVWRPDSSAAVNWYFRLKDKRLLWEKLMFVNTNEWASLQGQAKRVPGWQRSSWTRVVIYGDDLDIFGPLSVFHRA